MLSKSSGFTLLFMIISTWLASMYGLGPASPLGTLADNLRLADTTDVYLCLSLVAIGLICALFGGNRMVITAYGIVVGFVVLTLFQEPLVKYLTLAAVLFSIGMYGFVASRNAVRVLISIELMLNAVNINMVAFARYIDPVEIRGQLFAIFILTVAAAEAAVGLAIVLAIYRSRATVDMDRYNLLKW